MLNALKPFIDETTSESIRACAERMTKIVSLRDESPSMLDVPNYGSLPAFRSCVVAVSDDEYFIAVKLRISSYNYSYGAISTMPNLSKSLKRLCLLHAASAREKMNLMSYFGEAQMLSALEPFFEPGKQHSAQDLQTERRIANAMTHVMSAHGNSELGYHMILAKNDRDFLWGVRYNGNGEVYFIYGPLPQINTLLTKPMREVMIKYAPSNRERLCLLRYIEDPREHRLA